MTELTSIMIAVEEGCLTEDDAQPWWRSAVHIGPIITLPEGTSFSPVKVFQKPGQL